MHAFWRHLQSDDVYRQTYTGLYCSGCEDFYHDRDLINGCCPEHEQPVTPVSEENYFFRLSHYQQIVEELIQTDQVRIIPKRLKNEILSFVRRGLHDFSISRTAKRSGGWGITVPDDADQIIYVWIDALVNYLSGLGYGQNDTWPEYWNSDTHKIHFIGKNVWKFHAVYWLALLQSVKLPLPDEIFIHGFLTQDGRKISKSLGNAIDPLLYIEKYGADALRYYLLRAISPTQDGDFSIQRLHALYHSDLANGLGNLVSRLTALCENADVSGFRVEPHPPVPSGLCICLDNYAFDQALDVLWACIAELNRDIETVRPWELIRQKDANELTNHLTQWLIRLNQIAYWISPFLPDTSERIRRILNKVPIQRCKPLFPRL